MTKPSAIMLIRCSQFLHLTGLKELHILNSTMTIFVWKIWLLFIIIHIWEHNLSNFSFNFSLWGLSWNPDESHTMKDLSLTYIQAFMSSAWVFTTFLSLSTAWNWSHARIPTLAWTSKGQDERNSEDFEERRRRPRLESSTFRQLCTVINVDRAFHSTTLCSCAETNTLEQIDQRAWTRLNEGEIVGCCRAAVDRTNHSFWATFSNDLKERQL